MLWAVGMVIALVAIGLLVAKLYPSIWEVLSRERVATLIGIGVALIVIIVLLAIGGASVGWTGFSEKKLWDWLQLLSALAIPVVLAVAGFWFTAQQDQRQRQIEGQRAQAERELEEQRAQDEALQAYLDQMSRLLLEKDLSNERVRTLLRARTLTVLERLDPSRKTAVMQFLVEAELVQRVEGRRDPIIKLGQVTPTLTPGQARGADLVRLELSNADLRGADLIGVDLSNADLHGTDLSYTNLSNADLSNADLSYTNLSNATLDYANLWGADLSNAVLLDTVVTPQQLEDQAYSLEATALPDGTIRAGRYASKVFEPALSFNVSDGWRLASLETTAALRIEDPRLGQLIFTSPLHVFDPANLSKPKEDPAPVNADEWVSWFQRHPNLETSEPVPVSVGRASGMRIDVTPSSTPDNYPRDFCGERPCIPLFQSDGVSFSSLEGIKDRFVIVDVKGETVVIAFGAWPEDKFSEFLPKAQKVLATVEWQRV